MLLVLLLFFPVFYYTAAQHAVCTNDQYQWTFNTHNQSPCDIAAELGAVCDGGSYSVPPLPNTTNIYIGPNLEQANSCRCSSVFYSLLCACSLCQSRGYLKWSLYSFNCTDAKIGQVGSDIPTNTFVPHYAYLNVTADDEFNAVAAKAAGDAPESTRIPQPTVMPTATLSSSKSKAGPIAGGVIGGVAFLALVLGAAFWWTRIRRHRTRMADNQPIGNDAPMSFTSTTPFTASSQHKLYDPSDPSTYPSTSDISTLQTTQSYQPFLTANHSGNIHPAPHQARNYTGVAEI